MVKRNLFKFCSIDRVYKVIGNEKNIDVANIICLKRIYQFYIYSRYLMNIKKKFFFRKK